MASRNFTCPYCNQPTTITNPNQYADWQKIYIQQSTYGDIGTTVAAITCPNQECNQLSLKMVLTDAVKNSLSGKWEPKSIIQKWQLLPESEAKVLPDYIPNPITEDYYEACRIRDLSPKASATLSRRCLQGMIRNFWGISKHRLIDEIEALEEKVDPLVWQSIDSVRSVGNIGAHMEQDINLIIEVSPEEAQLLIGLIEQLIQDWYVGKHEREERLIKIKKMADQKKKKRGIQNS